MEMTREEILTKFDESWFHNHSLFGLKEILRIYNNAYINGETFLTRKEQKNVKKSIKSILRNTNRNKYVSKKDMKVVMDFADLFNRTMLHSKLVTRNLEQISQQELDDIYDRDRKIIFDVFLYLSAKLKPQISTYQIINEPAVSNSTVSIHV